MHRCAECGGEFGKYRKPGQCPLCGAWEMVRCQECGYHGAASFYLDAEHKCPRCGRETHLPGAHHVPTWVKFSMVAVVAATIGVLLVFVTS